MAEELKKIYDKYKHWDEEFSNKKIILNGPAGRFVYDFWQVVKAWNTRPGESPKGECEIGPYIIRLHPPIPQTDQVNVAWICKKDGEGMSLDLDKLWKDF